MKKILLILCAIILSLPPLWAYDFEIDGIYYNIDGTNVTVTYKDTNYNSYNGDIVIPSSVTYNDVTYSVTSIGDHAFNLCGSMTSVTIPEGITSIGLGAFHKCEQLTDIIIPKGVNSVGESAFSECTNLISATINEGITSIPQGMFMECSNLESVTIPEGVTIIDQLAFYGCALTSVTLPESVVSIGSLAFYCFDGVESIHISKNVNSISKDAFHVIQTEITVDPENNYFFSADGALYDKVLNSLILCPTAKTTITINENTSTIGEYAFNLCRKLTTITIPESVTAIGDFAFQSCDGLQTVYLPKNLSTIGTGVFYMCGDLKSIEIPEGVTSIGASAFAGCVNLPSIILPKSICEIGDKAFYGCGGLSSMTIPENVVSIGGKAFVNCSNLSTVYCNPIIPPTIYSSFDTSAKTLYVLPGSVIDYECSDWITYFSSVEEIFADGDDFVIDGLHYRIFDDKTLSVIAKDPLYSGDIIIPSSLTYNGITYSVTTIGDYAFDGCSGLTSITIPNSVSRIYNDAFKGCSSLTSITIPESVTSIGNDAFAYCSSLTSITIPDGVTSIGAGAFSDCSSLTSITIPDGVTSIGAGAFSDCSSLTSITIPQNITSIGGCAFADCSRLTSINIPESVTSIGIDAFFGCSSLTSINVDINNQNYTSLEGVLYDKELTTLITCPEKLTTVTIPNSVTSIGDYAFYGCSGLTSINIPESVTSIDYYAFCDCSGLTSITIPESVISIGEGVFANCSRLTSITIPESVTSIGDNAFTNCSNLTSVYCNSIVPPTLGNDVFNSRRVTLYVPAGSKEAYASSDWATYFNSIVEAPAVGDDFIVDGIRYKLLNDNTLSVIANEPIYSGDIVIPTSVIYNGIAYNITSIEDETFFGCKSLTSISIPGSVTTIGKHAFYHCTGLTSITIPNGVTSIGNDAFLHCSRLTSITIPESVTSIGNNAFAHCSGLTSITIPESVTSIGNNAFAYCSSLTSITIPNSVTSIGIDTFYGCSSLTSINVDINNSNYASLEGVLYNKGLTTLIACPGGLTSITIPESVTEIGSYAFPGCSSLTSINVEPNNPNYSSFEGVLYNKDLTTLIVCPGGLTSIKIPNSVISIGDSAFHDCGSLTSVTIPEGVTSIGNYAFWGCSGLTSITIPNSVTKIGVWAFSDCHCLISIAIPQNVTFISGCAFSNCVSLTSVTIPNSVTEIGVWAFSNCSNLTSVYCNSIVPPTLSNSSFDSNDATLYVPAGSKDAYASSDWASCFSSIEEIPNVNPDTPAANRLVIADQKVFVGKDYVLPVELINDREFTACQFDVYLPEGVEIPMDEDGYYLLEYSDRVPSRDTYECALQTNGAIRYIVYSSRNAVFTGNEGVLFNIPISISETAQAGEVTVRIEGINFTTVAAEEIFLDNVQAILNIKDYVIGDANGDEKLSLADVVLDISYILGQSPVSFNFEAADYNQDGSVSLADVVSLITCILNTPTEATAATAANKVTARAEEATPVNTLSIEQFEIAAGETQTLTIDMTNESAITACIFDIRLPKGLSIPNDEDEYPMVYLTSRSSRHTLETAYQPDGSLRVVAYSSRNSLFKNNSGGLFEIEIVADETFVAEGSQIEVFNIELIDTAATTFKPENFVFSFTSDTTGINDEVTDSVTVTAEGSDIVVKGVADDAIVEVYDVAGRMVYAGTDRRIAVAPHSFYVVKVNNAVYKVAL